MEKFIELGLSDHLIESISKLGHDTPTEIQKKSIPIILERQDVVAESSTGSGKTLAFGCGIIEQVEPGRGLQALVLTPTRELAEQVKQALWELAIGKKLRIMAVYGGVSINPQISQLAKADVVVATPGRMLDHLGRGTVNTKNIKVVVLDEADCMLDMGFIEDVQEIMEACPVNRHTMMFTATVSPKLRKLANHQLNKPKEIFAESQVDPSKLTQGYFNISRKEKIPLLLHLLKAEEKGLAMVFCNTRRHTDYVAKNLKANDIDAIAIHGGLSQNKRLKNIKSFSGNHFSVLVCTDVAARGIHVDGISHVYNYDIPRDPTDYVHRIGRTARAGEEGQVFNFLSSSERQDFRRIEGENRSFKIGCIDLPNFQRVDLVGSPQGDKRRGNFRGGSGNFRGRSGGRSGNRSSGGNRGRSFGGNGRSFGGNSGGNGRSFGGNRGQGENSGGRGISGSRSSEGSRSSGGSGNRSSGGSRNRSSGGSGRSSGGSGNRSSGGSGRSFGRNRGGNSGGSRSSSGSGGRGGSSFRGRSGGNSGRSGNFSGRRN